MRSGRGPSKQVRVRSDAGSNASGMCFASGFGEPGRQKARPSALETETLQRRHVQPGAYKKETTMKTQVLATLIGAAAAFAPPHAVGADISATYHPIGGSQWSVDFVVTGDGTPTVINNFTVYFPETS